MEFVVSLDVVLDAAEQDTPAAPAGLVPAGINLAARGLQPPRGAYSLLSTLKGWHNTAPGAQRDPGAVLCHPFSSGC